MTLQYSNYKGETYYLHKRTGKKGGSQYSFSRKEAGATVKSIPEGYEIYEDPNGRVFLRKMVPTKISREELSAVENSIRQYAKIKDYKIDVKGKAITIYLPDLEIDELRACFDSFALVNRSVLDETLKTMLTYSPVLRFILADEEKREFRAESAGFADPEDGWYFLDGGNDLQKLAKKYCRHLGKDSFYDLL